MMVGVRCCNVCCKTVMGHQSQLKDFAGFTAAGSGTAAAATKNGGDGGRIGNEIA
ncbi:MAG: hypothetical protein R3E39_09875 [Anaerolineae bacterium]